MGVISEDPCLDGISIQHTNRAMAACEHLSRKRPPYSPNVLPAERPGVLILDTGYSLQEGPWTEGPFLELKTPYLNLVVLVVLA